MNWLWSQWQDFAFGCAILFAGYVAIGLARWAWTAPRAFAAKLCGELALLCGILAVLWAAHLGEKHQWPF